MAGKSIWRQQTIIADEDHHIVFYRVNYKPPSIATLVKKDEAFCPQFDCPEEVTSFAAFTAFAYNQNTLPRMIVDTFLPNLTCIDAGSIKLCEPDLLTKNCPRLKYAEFSNYPYPDE